MSKTLSKIENIIFLFIIFILIILNIYGSIFMLASYWPCLDKNDVFPFVIAIILTISIILVFKNFDIRKKHFYIYLSISILLSLCFRIYLNRCFSAYPSSDQYQSLDCLNMIINENDARPLQKGQYFGICSYLANLIPLFFIPVKLFGYDALNYYDFNALLIVISIVSITMFVKNKNGYKAAFFTNLFMNLFIPLYFLDFVVYGDVFSLFFVSMSMFVLSLDSLKEYLKLIIASFLIGTAYMARSNSVVYIIALLISYLVFNKPTVKQICKIIICIIVFIFPSFTNQKFIEYKYKVDLESYSIPVSSFIYIGTGYSLDGDAGIYNPTGINTLSETNFNKSKTNSIMVEKVKENLFKLSDVNELALFLKRKLQNTWCDPDFETMGFVMPNEGYDVDEFVAEGYRLPVGTSAQGTTFMNNFGKFIYDNFMSIRKVEKVYLFVILVILCISSIIRIKNKIFDKTCLFLQLNTVGFFFLQIILETKPRYVLVSFIFFILLASSELKLLSYYAKDGGRK